MCDFCKEKRNCSNKELQCNHQLLLRLIVIILRIIILLENLEFQCFAVLWWRRARLKIGAGRVKHLARIEPHLSGSKCTLLPPFILCIFCFYNTYITRGIILLFCNVFCIISVCKLIEETQYYPSCAASIFSRKSFSTLKVQ